MTRLEKLFCPLLLGALIATGVAAQEPAEPIDPAPTGNVEPAPTGPAPTGPAGTETEIPPRTDAGGGALPIEDRPLAVDSLFQQLKTGAFWLTLIVTAVFGGLGGLVYELLMLKGGIEWPNKPGADDMKDLPYAVVGNVQDLGVWARVIIGALAAVAAVWLISPETATGLLAGAIIVGSAGTSVFRSLQDRMLATLAAKDAAETRGRAQQMQDKIQEVQKKLQNTQTVQAQVMRPQAAPPGGGGGGGGAPAIDPSLQEALKLLSEAEGIGEAM